jgi:hypothetical protein
VQRNARYPADLAVFVAGARTPVAVTSEPGKR